MTEEAREYLREMHYDLVRLLTARGRQPQGTTLLEIVDRFLLDLEAERDAAFRRQGEAYAVLEEVEILRRRVNDLQRVRDEQEREIVALRLRIKGRG